MRKYVLSFLLLLLTCFSLFACQAEEKFPHSLDTSILDTYKQNLVKEGFNEKVIKFRRVTKDKLPEELVKKGNLIGTYIVEKKVSSDKDYVTVKYYRNLECNFKGLSMLNKQEFIMAQENPSEITLPIKTLVSPSQYGELLDNTKEMGSFASLKDNNGKTINIDNFKITEEEINELKNTSNRFTPIFYTNDNVFLKNDVKDKNQKSLYISKYLISSKNDGKRFVELYNPTDQEINLQGYKIGILDITDTRPRYLLNLEGTIKPKDVFQIASLNELEPDLIWQDLKNLYGNNVLQLINPVNTFIDIIGNYASTLQGYKRDGELFIRREKRTKIYNLSDDNSSLVEINHGVRMFNFDDWAGYVETFKEPITLKKHPYLTKSSPDFPTELLNIGNLHGGITQVKTYIIHDGDTAQFTCVHPLEENYTGSSRIRYFLLDTPETEKPGHSGEPYAQAAKNFNTSLLNNASEVYIMSPIKKKPKQEGYGRYLALVWVKVTEGGSQTYKCINLELLKKGLIKPANEGDAKPDDYFDYNVLSNRHLYQWQREAFFYGMAHKLGVFSGDNTVL